MFNVNLLDLLDFFDISNLLIAAIAILAIFLLPGPIRIFKYLILQGFIGAAAMILINSFLPLYVNINIYTVAFSAILGLPGTLAMYALTFLT